MLIARHYTPEDLERVKALHQKQGLGYELPDLEAPSMLVRALLEEDGEILHAGFLRKTSEAYWLFDPKVQSNKARLGMFMVLQKELEKAARRVGLEDVHCWIPPEILDQKLHRTMLRMGWEKPEWTCYSRKVGE